MDGPGRIEKDKLTAKIDRVILADERDHTSEGVVLARKHEVTRAPFFVVTDDAKPGAGGPKGSAREAILQQLL